MSDGYIANPENNITFTYEDDGTQVCDPNLCVIAFGYRKNGELKWIDVRNLTTGETKRYMANVVEDIVYIWWNGNYVWTDINCHRLEVGGDSWEEFKDYVLEQTVVSLPVSSSDTIQDTDYTVKTEEDSNNNLVAKRITFANIWNWIKQKVSSFFGLTVTESGGSITNRSFDGSAKELTYQSIFSIQDYSEQHTGSNTATNLQGGSVTLKLPQSIDAKVNTIRPNGETDADDIITISDGETQTSLCTLGIPQGNYSSYWVMTTGNSGLNTQIAINHAGDGSANEIWFRHGHFSGSLPYWDNWQRLPTMDDVTSITAKYITSSAAGAAFADEAALTGTKYYAGQEITASTSPALGNNDYCIVLDSGASHNNVTARYVYQNGSWVFQYQVTQITLTQAQLDALNSGVTAQTYPGNAATATSATNADNATNATTATKTSKAITFNNDGAGAASGSTFDGSAARNVSYNTILTSAQQKAINRTIVNEVLDLTNAIGVANEVNSSVTSETGYVYHIVVKGFVNGSNPFHGSIYMDVPSGQKYAYSVPLYYSYDNSYYNIVVRFQGSYVSFYTLEQNIVNQNVRVTIEKTPL